MKAAERVGSTETVTVRFLRMGSLREFQACIQAIYGLPDDRLFSLTDLLVNQERFSMRALKGIRKNNQEKMRRNLLVAFSWTIAVCNRLHIDIEDALWHRFPRCCSYCGNAPCVCKATKLASRAVLVPRDALRPQTLADVQEMFRQIYPPSSRTLADAGVHLAEETGEVGEASSLFFGEHRSEYFESLVSELADWVSCMFGVANSGAVDVAAELENMYADNCHVCHHAPCVCSFSSVGEFHS
ncbi:MAG: MazG-like family protein [bacterium]|nr:MazG-like family protein [bacterium]